ncbi:major facilitator superfamily protein [Rhizodiscina lignyota]|uniref:Major facilitator superfamily protein n=1 Tax=Rhizodiscina lignyota TaxID=1504668 RepID=A0A9P4M2E2_9PEZI|nr:major facilitator superfamily protein [Rhizodiscina lignyota]
MQLDTQLPDTLGSSGRDEATDLDPTSGRVSKVGGKTNSTSLNKNIKFWVILGALAVTGLLTAIEATFTSTALPSILVDLGGGDLFIWVINGYFLAMTSLQPLYGQLSNVFGRRWPMIIATAIYTFGSGICGGANNIGMLIAGRVLQGIGAAGINVLMEIIICDLVPMRERGTYLAIIFGVIALGTALGPLFGGLIVQHSSWRWIFYLNLPIGGLALVLLYLFLNVNYIKEMTLSTRLAMIDWFGNVIFVLSVCSILISLSWAGSIYEWSSFHVLVPLIVGLAGLGAFLVFEGSRFVSQPTMPLRLLSNRTSATAYALTFMHSNTGLWALYFLPLYFQGVLDASPSRSGIQLLPSILVIIPAAASGGIVMSKLGRYRPIHHASYALMVVGYGLFTLLDENSSTGAWVGYQVVVSLGSGLIIPTLLPAVMASLPEADTALAAGTWSFLRSFGMTWGTAIPAAIFDNRFSQLAYQITNATVREELIGRQAYSHATAAFRDMLQEPSRRQFITVLDESLRRIWQIAIGFAGFGFLLAFIEKEVPLREELDTQFGIAGEDKKTSIETGDGGTAEKNTGE